MVSSAVRLERAAPPLHGRVDCVIVESYHQIHQTTSSNSCFLPRPSVLRPELSSPYAVGFAGYRRLPYCLLLCERPSFVLLKRSHVERRNLVHRCLVLRVSHINVYFSYWHCLVAPSPVSGRDLAADSTSRFSALLRAQDGGGNVAA